MMVDQQAGQQAIRTTDQFQWPNGGRALVQQNLNCRPVAASPQCQCVSLLAPGLAEPQVEWSSGVVAFPPVVVVSSQPKVNSSSALAIPDGEAPTQKQHH